MRNLLSKLVSINSAYPHEQRIVDYICDYVKNKKVKITKQKVENKRYNILLEKGKGKKSIMLYSHLDTVNITEGWKTDPLTLTIKDDKAYGLGAWDMKSGLTVCLNEFLEYQPKNIKLKLALCVDEEGISKGAYVLMKSGFMKDVDCVLSTAPAFQYALQGIVTGRKGRAVYEIIIQGKSRHFYFYESKYDSILFAGKLLDKLSQEIDKKIFVFARKIFAEAVGFSVPQKTVIEIDSSIYPPITSKHIMHKIIYLCDEINKEYKNYFIVKVDFIKRETPFLEGYKIDPDNAYLDLLKQSILEVTNKKAIPYFRPSVSDENIFGAGGITTFEVGPVGGNAHAPNEWVSLSSLSILQKILHQFLRKADTISSY
jgi:acetylornithine deacetylase/succinyl-diaminopimelate desuccinylase-like protein